MKKSTLLEFALGTNPDLSKPFPKKSKRKRKEENEKLETFFNTLSKQQKRLFLELEDVFSEEKSHSGVYLYIRGLRAGAKMIMELFEEERRLF